MQGLEPRRGRPRKFAAPSRAVTLTLPEHVIDALGSVDADLSRAVVQLTQPALALGPRGKAATRRPAELTRFGRHAVIVVNPTPTLEKRTGVELVPLPDGRALIALEQPTTIADLELFIEDSLDAPDLAKADAAVFQSVLGILREARRSSDIAVLQRSIIVLETRKLTRRKKR